MKAEWAVNCFRCGGLIFVGDEIQTFQVIGDGAPMTVAYHIECWREAKKVDDPPK